MPPPARLIRPMATATTTIPLSTTRHLTPLTQRHFLSPTFPLLSPTSPLLSPTSPLLSRKNPPPDVVCVPLLEDPSNPELTAAEVAEILKEMRSCELILEKMAAAREKRETTTAEKNAAAAEKMAAAADKKAPAAAKRIAAAREKNAAMREKRAVAAEKKVLTEADEKAAAEREKRALAEAEKKAAALKAKNFFAHIMKREFSTTTRSLSPPASESKPPRRPLTKEERDFLSSALRVNQAGELAATLIYKSQTPLITRTHPHLSPLMSHMYAQEASHLSTFNHLLSHHRVRPTALYPLWSVLATGLGWSTAMMGREAAMACTEAVETEIGDHYNGQIRVLLEIAERMETEGGMGPELKELVQTLRRIRDEELEHLDHAVENDAQKAEPHWLLTGAIRLGCRGAIWVSEKV